MEDRREVAETNSEQSEEKSDSDDSKEESSWKWIPWILLGVYLLACFGVSYGYWDQLRGDEDSLADTLRSLGVVYGAPAGIVIAIWRSNSAREQAAAARAQGQAADKQVEAANAALEANTARTKQIEDQNEIADRHAVAAEGQITAARDIAKDQNKIADRHAVAAEGQITAARDIAKDQNKIADRHAVAAEGQITAARDIAKDQNKIAERRAVAAEQQLGVSTQIANKQVQAAEAQLAAGNAQVAAAEQQEKAARLYGDAAKESAQDARYRRGVEALGHNEMSIRLAGVYDLEALFHENYDRYGVRVVKLLCAFARNPPRLDMRMEICSPLREDVQTAVSFIGSEVQEMFQAVDHDQQCEIDLRGAALPYADMRKANMSDVDFSEAILIEADFSSATLTGAEFRNANILGAKMVDAIFENDQLEKAKHSKFVYGLEDPSSSE